MNNKKKRVTTKDLVSLRYSGGTLTNYNKDIEEKRIVTLEFDDAKDRATMINWLLKRGFSYTSLYSVYDGGTYPNCNYKYRVTAHIVTFKKEEVKRRITLINQLLKTPLINARHKAFLNRQLELLKII